MNMADKFLTIVNKFKISKWMNTLRELEKLIDGIPVPDITVSSMSQQSDRLTPQSKKKQSLTREQVQRILRRTTEQTQIPINKQKVFTMQTFNCKENSNDEQMLKIMKQKEGKGNSELQILQHQIKEQQKVIEQQIHQIGQINIKIEYLTNELQDNQEKRQADAKKVLQLQQVNEQQQQIIEDLRNELQMAKRVSSQQQNREQDSMNQISLLKSKINCLESEINRTRTTFTLTSPKNDTMQTDVFSNRIDPELLSEEETLTVLFSLLGRVSKSQRMSYLLNRNADFKFLIKCKRSQPSMNKISILQNSKSMCDRKLSYNHENFKQIVKNVGIKNQ
ncbi:unnamed protein product (macronuclear) [Paramecium tetraurelia]|uniref:Uncharacterized protein n=1 Tax=Paramecium tetraurelia TaxID=5888 RepID=A0DW56_PARTE|nr:uncharacterized protein GSPATT00020926001 [Paramecium tetraurelia]CAK87273.1 unnamed protein product [Paramecium tetraurelia]|eukprot:XP_001454670.1 hypothetical protein (macronuclear) [Paramecium tetraurelia strain d4-2]